MKLQVGVMVKVRSSEYPLFNNRVGTIAGIDNCDAIGHLDGEYMYLIDFDGERESFWAEELFSPDTPDLAGSRLYVTSVTQD